MAIADRIGINASGVIYYDSTAGAHDHTSATAEYFTVIELHRFLQDLADDASASGDDLIDITNDTPSDRSTDKGRQQRPWFHPVSKRYLYCPPGCRSQWNKINELSFSNFIAQS